MTALYRLMRNQTIKDRFLSELELARREIREGRFQRSMAVIAAFAAIVSGYEAYSQHVRGAFRHWLMWTPVWLTVPTVITALMAVFSKNIARLSLPLVSLISLIDGVVGFVFHLRGIRRMPGGFKIGQYNVVIGPPIFAPLLLCTVGAIGLLAGFLRREQIQYPWWNRGLFSKLADEAPVNPKPKELQERIIQNISHGQFQQGMALMAGSFAILAGGEAYFEHMRGSFNRRVMWAPVWITPVMVIATVRAAASKQFAQWILLPTSVAISLVGFLGFALHLQGIKRMPGGFSNFQFNATLGPPLFAPLLFSAVGLLGFVAAFLRRRVG